MITIEEIQSKDNWGSGLDTLSIPLTQTYMYGEIQKSCGRQVRRFNISYNGSFIGIVQFVEYPLINGLKYWYAPYGPVLREVSLEILRLLKVELERVVIRDVAFVRLDFSPVLLPPVLQESKRVFHLAHQSSVHGAYFQPRNEWYTDISYDDDEVLLGHMHQKTRYSIKYAQRKGVSIQIVQDNLVSEMDGFLCLMKTTSNRNNFALHDESYYKTYLEEVDKEKKGFLVKAFIGDTLLATHLIIVEGDTAHYVFGASSDEKRELCGPYLAHFAAMQKARSLGLRYYNFGGISLGDNKSWGTLTVFKQKFGGQVFPHTPLLDFVVRPVWYYVYIFRKIIRSIIS